MGKASQFHLLDSLSGGFMINRLPAEHVFDMGMTAQQYVIVHISPEFAWLFLQQNAQNA